MQKCACYRMFLFSFIQRYYNDDDSVLLCRMQFVLYFYDDRTVVALDESDVILGEYSEYEMENWASESSECKVQALYDDRVYQACVLQVAPDSMDVTEICSKLNGLISRKRTRVKQLLGLLKRVAPTRRQIIAPMDTFFTESEREGRRNQRLDATSSDSSESNRSRIRTGTTKTKKARTGGHEPTIKRRTDENSASSSSDSGKPAMLKTKPVTVKLSSLKKSDVSTQTDRDDGLTAFDERLKLMERRILTEIVKLRRELGARSSQFHVSDISLPLSCSEDLAALNEKLSDESSFNSLVTQLSGSEGLSGEAFTRNILKRLFSNAMNRTISWSGRGTVSSLKGSRVFEAIWRAVNTKYPTFEMRMVKKTASDYFKFAKRGGKA